MFRIAVDARQTHRSSRLAFAFAFALGLVTAAIVAPSASAAATVKASPSAHATASARSLPPVRHVWVFMLENHSYTENFGPVALRAPRSPEGFDLKYLSEQLPSEGAVLANYFGVAHPSESNYTAMVSGQPPNLGTLNDSRCPKMGFNFVVVKYSICPGQQLNCPYYTEFNNGKPPPFTTVDNVAIGQGCVYPKQVSDVGTQMRQASLSVKTYAEDMVVACRHPALGGYDPPNELSTPGYETGDNPFMYFQNWIGDPSVCARDDVSLDRNTFQPLFHDLEKVDTTPNLSFIQPDLCDSGHNYCPGFDSPGTPKRESDFAFFRDSKACGGSQPLSEYCNAQSSAWLSWIIPKITESPAYKRDGLIVVVWDEANFYNSSDYADYTACCGEGDQPGPSGNRGVTGYLDLPALPRIPVTPGLNPAMAGGTTDSGGGFNFAALADAFLNPFGPSSHDPTVRGYPGGGDSGAVVLSPFIKGGTTVVTNYYNHYSLLRTIEDIFDLPHIGLASAAQVKSMGSDVFNKESGLRLSPCERPANCNASATLQVTRVVRQQGDGLVVAARCAREALCAGLVTLTAQEGRQSDVLARRTYASQSGQGRFRFTLYLDSAAQKFIHSHGGARLGVTTAPITSGNLLGGTIRWRGNFALPRDPTRYVPIGGENGVAPYPIGGPGSKK